MNGLILHSGAHAATRAEVAAVPTPDITATHVPIPHLLLIELVRQGLLGSSYEITSEEHGLWQKGQVYFGIYRLAPLGTPDYSLLVGIRNSHNKASRAAVALGSNVFVCDNWAFSGEVVLGRKHTLRILADLPGIVVRAIAKLSELRITQDRRIGHYKGAEVNEVTAHDLVVRAVDAGVIPNARIPAVLGEWRKPKHEAFQPRNAWSLFNAFTEILKAAPVVELPRRTTKLFSLFDGATQLSPFTPSAN